MINLKKKLKVKETMKLGSDIKQAIETLALDKGVAVESMYEALVSAFRSAYMRIPGAAEEARVTLDPDSGEITAVSYTHLTLPTKA